MFNRKPTPADTRPDAVIDAVIAHMATTQPDTDAYAKMVDQLTKLYAIKTANPSPDRVSKETLATILSNLAGIGMIVGHERAHVVTSKALGFIVKARA